MKIKLEKNKDITSYLTLKTKVRAEYFFEAKTREDLIMAKKTSIEQKLPLLILAGGSNFAITKDVISGLVVKNSYSELELVQENKNEVLLLVSSGYPVSKLVNETIEKGWSGFAYHKGLPGTVGGAIYNNSKWTKPLSSFGDNLIEAWLVDKAGKVKKVNRDYFQFAYDFSILQKTKEILLEAIFRLNKSDPKELKKQSQEAFAYRRQTQPQGVFSSGCFFQNVSGKSAGEMIDKAGLKGHRVGNFQVSKKHANFIINMGDGKGEDLKKLIEIIKDRVRDKFGVELKEEVNII